MASVTFKLLETKKFILRSNKNDNRKKSIELSNTGIDLFSKVKPLILKEEKNIFGKLQNENYNFTNSLKLLLGKRLRIKANNIQ